MNTNYNQIYTFNIIIIRGTRVTSPSSTFQKISQSPIIKKRNKCSLISLAHSDSLKKLKQCRIVTYERVKGGQPHNTMGKARRA